MVVWLCGGSHVHAQNLAFKETHTLCARWELADSLRNGTFLITPYRPVYVLPAVWSSDPNRSPRRFDAPPTTVLPTPLDAVECKFQFSFKTKVVQGLFKNRSDIWVGYTQSSRWQVYNAGLSRPFRETNYEPEVMIVVPLNYRVFGVRGRLLALGLNHQSNGGGEPFSRSWNRVVLQVGLERGRYTLLLRPWLRIPESRASDDNPDINGSLGNGEVLLIFGHKSHVASVQVRSPFLPHPFLGGSVQGDWSFTISGPLKAHLQLFHGFGESLLDYNHEQTTIGLGVSLLDWL